MKINLKVPISVYVEPIPQFSFDDSINYTIDVDRQDIVEYFYYKKYNKQYQELSWYLEEGAKEFVHHIEDEWMHNKIDEYELSNSKEFKTFLKKKYSHEIEREYLSTHDLDDIEDEMLDFIKDNFKIDCEVISNG